MWNSGRALEHFKAVRNARRLGKCGKEKEIRAWFDGIEITETTPDILKDFASNPTIMLETGNKVYQLKSTGWSGYVLGGIIRTLEDDGESFAPSLLIETA